MYSFMRTSLCTLHGIGLSTEKPASLPVTFAASVGACTQAADMQTGLVQYQTTSSDSATSDRSSSVEDVKSAAAVDGTSPHTATDRPGNKSDHIKVPNDACEPSLRRVRAFEHKEGQWALSIHLPGAPCTIDRILLHGRSCCNLHAAPVRRRLVAVDSGAS